MAKEDDIRKGVIAIVVIVALVSFAFLYAGSTAEEVTFDEEGDMIGLAASKLPGYDRCTRAMVGKYACFKDAEWKCSKKRKRFGTAFRWIKTGEECGRTIPRQPQPVPVDCKELDELSCIKYNECEPIRDRTCGFAGCTIKEVEVNKTPTNDTICKDTDGGKNIYVKGTTKGYEVEGKVISTFNDYCGSVRKEEGKLKEYYCGEKGLVKFELYDCPGVCRDGACITRTPPIAGNETMNKTPTIPENTTNLSEAAPNITDY